MGFLDQGSQETALLRRGPVQLALIGLMLLPLPAIAAPATLFMPYVDRIRSSLPPNFEMRLPADVRLGDAIPLEPEALIVRLFPASSPPRFTIGLFTCESGPFPCLVGSFSVEAAASANAQRETDRHRSAQVAIELAPGVEGYYIGGRSPSCCA